MSDTAPTWRSLLFLPAHVDKFVERAHTRGADAYILDLEDSVPLAQKASAREQLQQAVDKLVHAGVTALVRVNADDEARLLDLDAAVSANVSAIVLPKVGLAEHVQSAAAHIAKLEQDRGISPGRIRLIAQIEDVDALVHLDAIAGSSPRLMAMILGSEDFSASAGMEPIPEALLLPNQLLLFACRRAGIQPLGFPASISDYSDIEAFRQRIRFARQLGFVGAFAIHPTQVAVLNEEFSPSSAEIDHASGLIAAYAAAVREGRGAIEYAGKMVDPPVVARAEALLRRARSTTTSQWPDVIGDLSTGEKH